MKRAIFSQHPELPTWLWVFNLHFAILGGSTLAGWLGDLSFTAMINGFVGLAFYPIVFIARRRHNYFASLTATAVTSSCITASLFGGAFDTKPMFGFWGNLGVGLLILVSGLPIIHWQIRNFIQYRQFHRHPATNHGGNHAN